MSRIAYVNGRYVPHKDAEVSMMTVVTSLVTVFMRW